MLEMVYVPDGTFLMGQTEAEKQELIRLRGEKKYEEYYRRELPQHEVHVKEFRMGKYPVTQAQWEALMGNNPSKFKGANRPVEKVSWDDVQEFLKKLNAQGEKNRGNPPLPLPGGETPPWPPLRGEFRLPSEAEWEYACRAGTSTPFYFGETISPDLANYDGNYTYASGPKGEYRQQTTDVGSFPPNAFGLCDMHGNVWEWCADPWHDNYEGAPQDGSVWEKAGNARYRLLRGGSWSFDPHDLRCASRSYDGPDIRTSSSVFGWCVCRVRGLFCNPFALFILFTLLGGYRGR
jgi:formylglycine-generating enzyme required for sulfatase activity